METCAGDLKGQKVKKISAARQAVRDKKLAILCLMFVPLLISVV